MKKIMMALGLLFFVWQLQAQSQADMQKIKEAQKKLQQLKSSPQYKEAMQKAQQAMQKVKMDTSIQRQMSTTEAKLNDLKTTHPELANVNIPDINQMQIPAMPNLDSLSNRLDQSVQKVASLNNAIDQATPKLNPFHHAEKLAKLSKKDLMAIAQLQLGKAEKNLNPFLPGTLKKIVKDTSMNPATTGAFLLASGGDKNAAVYLICSAILKNPNDVWAINDLGVYYRDMKDLELSMQCYFYANELDTGRNTAINANIGWASAYYGDFETALKYFAKALTVDPDFQSANEGEALISYAKGDIAALFQCLAKEINSIGGAGGPSTSFIKTASKEAAKEMNQETNKDPSDDHTFDNSLPDDAPDTPPGADVDDVTFPIYKKVFVNRPEDIGMAFAFGSNQLKSTFKQLSQEIKSLTAQLRTLKPLGQKPYIDEDEGYLIYPSNFEKYIIPLTPIEMSYDKRIQWWQKKFYEKLKLYAKDVHQHDRDLLDKYLKESGQCPQPDEDDKCHKRVSCKWVPIIYKSENSDLEGLSRMWNDYYGHVFAAVNWYLKATAPFISRVHQEGWNEYLNAYRKYKVKIAYYELYSAWVEGLRYIAGIYSGSRPEELETCSEVHNATPADAPDPFSKKPKHIKEFEGPCFNIPSEYVIGTIVSTCHGDKFQFGYKNLNLCYSHTTDQIAAQNQGYANDVNFTASVEKDFKIAEIGGKDVSVKGGLSGNIDMKFDNDWNFTSGKSSVSATADIGHVHIADASISRTAAAEVVSGQRTVQVGELSTNFSGPSIK